MTKLNQIIAVEKGAKAQANDAITVAYHVLQKPDMFAGIARTYEPRDEDGEQFPPESTRVQETAERLLTRTLTGPWTRLLDVTATKDWANGEARADVVIDDLIIIADAPVTYLIWLEKQLVDLRTMVTKLPTLDPAFDWQPGATAGQGAFQTQPVQTARSKKIPRNHVKAEATKEHPAQVDVYTEDVLAGYWTTVRLSGALPQERIDQLVSRVEALQRAVKFAREEANGHDVTDRRVGGPLFDFLLA